MKLSIFFAFYPYGGNGGISMEYPEIRRWFARTMLWCKKDERIGAIYDQDFADTPITMTRNRSVKTAREMGADILVMCDSDMHPDLYQGQLGTKLFFPSSFAFLYEHYQKGPVVIGAPYCGPPPSEMVYVFHWTTCETDNPNPDHRLEMISREQAAMRMGIEAVAALPTGLIMFDMRVFELTSPPYFYYEYTDCQETDKASTEDVTCTRDLGMAGQNRLGYVPIHVNWDAWAGHVKPKTVGKPHVIHTEQVGKKYREAVLADHRSNEKLTFVRPDGFFTDAEGKLHARQG